MEANQPNSKEEILKKHITATGIKMGETELSMRQSILDTEKSNPEFFDSILSAMTEYRSIGEREAREQVINELVGWMEEQRLPHNYKSQVYSTLTYCITHAKSLLNQQGAVEKTYGEKLIDAIEKLERMGLWEEWKEENPSKVNALKKLINEKSNQQGEEAKCPQHWAFNYFDDTLNQALCSYCKKPN